MPTLGGTISPISNTRVLGISHSSRIVLLAEGKEEWSNVSRGDVLADRFAEADSGFDYVVDMSSECTMQHVLGFIRVFPAGNVQDIHEYANNPRRRGVAINAWFGMS